MQRCTERLGRVFLSPGLLTHTHLQHLDGTCCQIILSVRCGTWFWLNLLSSVTNSVFVCSLQDLTFLYSFSDHLHSHLPVAPPPSTSRSCDSSQSITPPSPAVTLLKLSKLPCTQLPAQLPLRLHSGHQKLLSKATYNKYICLKNETTTYNLWVKVKNKKKKETNFKPSFQHNSCFSSRIP